MPGAISTEGIASGAGNTFYVGDLVLGDVYRGDVRGGPATLFIDAPAGRMAAGMKADLRNGLLFVAGAATGHGYVYDLATGEPVADYTFASGDTFINDVTLTNTGAWFTDSRQARLYFVPVVKGQPGEAQTLMLSGPAADLSGQFNNNGIAALPDGSLLVAHSGNAVINKVEPSGASATVSGVSVPNADGILLQGRTLWVVQNFANQVSGFQLDGSATTGTLRTTVTSQAFQVPTTVALFGNRLALANAKFDTGIPPAAPPEVVVVDR